MFLACVRVFGLSKITKFGENGNIFVSTFGILLSPPLIFSGPGAVILGIFTRVWRILVGFGVVPVGSGYKKIHGYQKIHEYQYQKVDSTKKGGFP